MTYPLHRAGAVPASPDLPALEAATLAYWKEDGTFRASIEQRPAGQNGANEFVFYDGPPFATGLPHYGHLLTGYVKDAVGRFRTQCGQRVERRFGWDTHGLPAELEAQRELRIVDKAEIDELGVEGFNEACRNVVMKYANEWREYVTRQARWVDFEGDYKTLDTGFMESVIWTFGQLYRKGLAYEGYRVLPYCWKDQTPLSNHELRMDDDVYQMRTDQTVTVGVRLHSGELALLWTTTPWTLPANLALAVGPEVSYVTVVPNTGDLAGEKVILAEALLGAYEKELGKQPEVVARALGQELAGRRYHPIFDFYLPGGSGTRYQQSLDGGAAAPGEHAFTIISGDFVTTEDGTGIVHLAPAFGEEDMAACQVAGIETVVTVDEAGRFHSAVADYKGMQVFEANRHIIRDLRESSGPLARRPAGERAALVRQASYAHSYPHCWRCREPLIYKAVSSWFVRVSEFRDRMVELNQQITWVPEHTKDGIFGNWLAGARDWSISRNRYWGTPIPVWKSDNPDYPRLDVYGSLEELERDFGTLPYNRQGEVDLHRPFIDELTRPNPDDPTGQSTMRRIPDILDVWFDSGSMPWAQNHYPAQARDWFEHHFPGDFIVEYIGQTRGWFYTLHALSTAIFDKPAFRSCISHGIVLGNDGRKASKSLRNYPDPMEMFDKYGSDAIRWALLSSTVLRGGNLVVAEESIRDAVRTVILPLWNSWYFLALYAGTVGEGAGYRAEPLDLTDRGVLEGLDVMDRYVLARTKALAASVRASMDAYDIPQATLTIRDHLDLITNWYVRTSRDRFWEEDKAAFDTLATALRVLTEVAAPLLPMVGEEVWRGLTGGRSVHLTDWPELPETVEDTELVAAMDEVREIVSAVHALRKVHKLRVRQPLRSLRVVTAHPDKLAPFTELIASEVNVKGLTLETAADSGLELVRELAIQPRELPAELRKLTSKLFAAQKAGDWQEVPGGIRFPGVESAGAAVVLQEGQYTLATSVVALDGSAADVLGSGTVVVLDTALDQELEDEGYARDLVRTIQDTRKAARLHVSDRIALTVAVPAARREAITRHADMVAREVLALEFTVTESPSEAAEIVSLQVIT